MFKRIINTYLTQRFFIVALVLCGLFIASHPLPFLFWITVGLVGLFFTLCLFDWWQLNSKKVVLEIERPLPQILSLGNENKINILINNESKLDIKISIIDELPFQFQSRDFEIKIGFKEEQHKLSYPIRPLTRGEYHFGKVLALIQSKIGLIERKVPFNCEGLSKCYPSVKDMKTFQLLIDGHMNAMRGIRKIRRIGQSSEFEQIKEYVSGDDYNKINWKSTGRVNKLMMNHYTDEKSQFIYSFIDKSKSMSMPFGGMSLLDYSINTSLMISNSALLKKDQAGVISFAKDIENTIKAGDKNGQLSKILESLYKEEPRDSEADFEKLYYHSRNILKKRSLIFLYTNFESRYAMERALPILKNISKVHLLIPIVFKNEELENYYLNNDAESIKEIYLSTITQKHANEKDLIIQELNRHGIQCIYTSPQLLSTSVLNKYLEMKSRGMI